MISPPAIALQGIGRTYAGAVPVVALRDCTLTVQTGEHVAIMGPSGSGKSTLLNVLGLLDRPTDGTYLLDGLDVSRMSDVELSAVRARRLGFVFQSFHLLSYRDAVDNVALGLLYSGMPARTRRARARSALARVGLTPRQHALPGEMSGGERQRVAIARATVGEPSVLLCDEPTGNLDSATSAEVLDLLDAFCAEGLTLLVITHDADVAARAGRTVRVVDGVVTELSAA